MASAPELIPSEKRASVSQAKRAYFDGDFERCLATCADIPVRSAATASEVALLRARSLLRTGRPREAEVALADTFTTHISLDASLTAAMLLGTARIRQADCVGGLAILAAASARSSGAHLTIRSEISFATALGHWAQRDLDSAERALALVDERSDIIHARSLELAAWCQMARGNYRQCADLFVQTLVRLDTCQANDQAIAGAAISTLAILGAELFDAEIARVADLRARAMTWPSGLQKQHYLTLLYQALFAEISGNTIGAYELSIRAQAVAPTVAYAASAWSVNSIVARNADEPVAAIVFAKLAIQSLGSRELSEFTGEEPLSLLFVAESCAHFDLPAADRFFAIYRNLNPIDPMVAMSADPCLVAEENVVAGVIAEARGDVADAQRCYREAFTVFKRVGFVRRAVITAFALMKLHFDESIHQYLTEQLKGTANYITTQLDRRRFAAVKPLDRHPIFTALPSVQREVVGLICEGKSNKEIARLRNVSEQTIKNMLSMQVFPVFGVTSRAALISACLGGPRSDQV